MINHNSNKSIMKLIVSCNYSFDIGAVCRVSVTIRSLQNALLCFQRLCSGGQPEENEQVAGE